MPTNPLYPAQLTEGARLLADNPYKSPDKKPRRSLIVRIWQWIMRRPSVRLFVCDSWDCKEPFVMDDFYWFRENCTRCGKSRPWEECRRAYERAQVEFHNIDLSEPIPAGENHKGE